MINNLPSKPITFIENQSSLDTYLQEIDYPSLTDKQEQVLILKIKKGNAQARQLLIKSNLKLVVHLAKKNLMKVSHLDININLEDLIEEGNLGLLKAIEKYDPTKSLRFDVYAAWRINISIFRYIQNQSKHPISTTNIIDIENKDIPSLEETVILLSLSKELQKLIEKCNLTPNEKIVLTLRYGLNGQKIKSSEEIGYYLNLSATGIHRLESSALQKIRRSDCIIEFAYYLDNPNKCLQQLSYFRTFKPSCRKTVKGLLENYHQNLKQIKLIKTK